jgi:RHS repeat-associated protein
LNATNNALVRSYLWGVDLSGTTAGVGGVGGLVLMNSAANGVHFAMYDGNGNVAGLTKATDGTVSANYEYGPFGETLRATGAEAREMPFRFSTKRTDNSTDLVLYEYRIYGASAGRWLSRDPVSEMGGLNVYACLANDPVDRSDGFGLCHVYSSGLRYRVSIASLDSHQVGTPYADLAKVTRAFLDSLPAYQPLRMRTPEISSAGPFTFANPEGPFTAGAFVAAHFLFYADWEIDEADGPCTLNVFETGSIRRGTGEPRVQPPRSGPAPPDMWKVADRKNPSPSCGTKTLIFVDAPGSRAYLKPVPGVAATFGGFRQEVSQKLEVIDKKSGNVVGSTEHKVTIGLADDGGLIADP